jgi:hypothetical protein
LTHTHPQTDFPFFSFLGGPTTSSPRPDRARRSWRRCWRRRGRGCEREGASAFFLCPAPQRFFLLFCVSPPRGPPQPKPPFPPASHQRRQPASPCRRRGRRFAGRGTFGGGGEGGAPHVAAPQRLSPRARSPLLLAGPLPALTAALRRRERRLAGPGGSGVAGGAGGGAVAPRRRRARISGAESPAHPPHPWPPSPRHSRHTHTHSSSSSPPDTHARPATETNPQQWTRCARRRRAAACASRSPPWARATPTR